MHFYRATDFAAKSAYTDVKSFFDDLNRIFREEIADLTKAGCKYIQLDEVAIALLCDPNIRKQVEAEGMKPDELVDLYIDSINECGQRRAGRCGVRRAYVPRQFQGPLSRCRRL